MTFVELSEKYDEYLNDYKDRANDQITLAYNIAKLIRAEKLPELKDLLIDYNKAPKKEQTTDELVQAMRSWNAAHGGKENINWVN